MSAREPAAKRMRLDLLVVERGWSESRSKAQALILAGQVLVAGQRSDKPGTLVRRDADVALKQQERYVSRGGVKLEGALTSLEVDPAGLVCVDVGASTGGFTDCLLQRGTAKVYAVDVGHGLLAQRLALDPRVVVMDGTNARFLTRESFPEAIDLLVCDASFIGVTQLVGAFAHVLPRGGHLLHMIKPQFEVGREAARRTKGVISDPALRASAIDSAIRMIEEAGFEITQRCDSQLAGPKGNVEHFVLARRA